ncbi:synaptojanin-2-binding protein isoform X2 [Pristis pectinata]|uniref:synaptojanin-2-binding protein isoform X2 n=1 Tax=Pristis pectinata TaxID=685728 RepID=UPI00223D4941|nr:synaptojanin-2-binding protein isoform X2 [Pristis pectinata]
MSCTSFTTLTEEIRLKRGASGLGFNIIGGTDYQPNCKDSAIYVSKIKDDGPAALDGRLKERDQILAIIKNNQNSKSTLSPLVMAALGITVLAICVYVKYRRRL